MSREAEKKLLECVVRVVGTSDVAKRLAVSESEIERMADGREWLTREQVLSLAELIVETVNQLHSQARPRRLE